jgi:cyanobactin maturation PatA/PatG family protease
MIETTQSTDVVLIPGLQELWAETLGDPQICIAVLDGPVDQSHSSLVGANLTRLETLVSGVANQGPALGHGTHIASVIFGQHNGPVKGIAPQCRGMIVPIFSDGPDNGIAPCSQLDLARAIIQAVQGGANVINISGGEVSLSGTAHPILADAVRACAANNVLIVAAAGNDGCECLHIPGALPSVLAVGAMDAVGNPLESSNWGARGILAPGDNILGAVPGGGTSNQSGTSYATAIVSGAAALLLSLQRKLGQKVSPQAIRTAILASARPCDSHITPDCRPFMAGSLDVSGALMSIRAVASDGSVDQPSEDKGENGTLGVDPPVSNGSQTLLSVGEIAPEFSLRDHTGGEVRLSDFTGKYYVVLWFFPEANTPG